MRTLFTLLFMTILSMAQAQLWIPTELSSMPERMSNNAVVEAFHDGKAYVYSFTGLDSTKIWSGTNLKSYRYDVDADQWSMLPPVTDPLGGKIAAGASFIDSVIYIIGGYHVAQNGSEVSSSKVHRFHVPSNSWMSDGADIPIAIDDHIQTVWRDSLIYVVTGWSNVTNVINVQIYDPGIDSWVAGTSIPNSTSYRVFGGSGTIVGDTIWYFGGASLGNNFPISNRLRRGLINPDDPTQIFWTSSIPASGIVNYRAAAFESEGLIHWIGGSNITYNYNGIAYNGSGGVPPNDQNIIFNPLTNALDTSLQYAYPMDLRGVAKLDDQTVILAGGMETNQEVSNKTWRLDRFQLISTALEQADQSPLFVVFPNPATTYLEVQFATQVNGSWSIYSPSGRWLTGDDIIQPSLRVDVRTFPPGMYYLTIRNAKGNFYRPFLVGGKN